VINFSGLSHDSFLGRAARLPLALIPGRAVVPIVAGPLRGMRWRVGSSNHGCWLGSYELEKQRAIAAWVKPGMVVYDVGANAGFYTLLFARLAGPSGSVFAIEPFAENLVNLIDHVAMNGIGNCRVIQAAVARTRGIAAFSPGASRSTGAIGAPGAGSAILVPTVSLDGMVDELGYPAPDLVKMDIEGGESDALAGAAALLEKGNAIWFIALHGDDQKRRCQRLLLEAGYALHTVAGDLIREPLDSLAVDEIYARRPTP
jgi:FkbM family methyltransferase